MRLFLSNHPECIGIDARMELDDESGYSDFYECLEPGQEFLGVGYDELRALGEKEQPVDVEFPDQAGGG